MILNYFPSFSYSNCDYNC